MPFAPLWPSLRRHRLYAAIMSGAIGAALGYLTPAFADKISHPTATFDGLDKITGRIISFDVAMNETVQFGTLQITPRACFSRPPTDPPRTDAFAQVDEIDEQKQHKRIFSGWMFADSPGLHGIEHPIYDIWLTDCKGGTVVIHEKPQVDASATDAGDNPDVAPAPPTDQPAAQPQPAPRKKPKPRPAPAVVAAPLPAPENGDNAPLDLGGGGNTYRGR